MEGKIRVFEMFSGIGAFSSALERLNIPHETVVCEIDETAHRAYEAIHGPTENLGDVTKLEHAPECDLLTYSWPCTSISLAGKREGMKEGSGTASSLLWEVGRLLDDMKERNCLPEVLVSENVDAVMNKDNKPLLDKWIIKLNQMGYTTSYDILNAKDFGIPQNRRRHFMVSTLHMGKFIFPKGWELKLRLKDMLEDNVDESYYLSDERIAKYERHAPKQSVNKKPFLSTLGSDEKN